MGEWFEDAAFWEDLESILFDGLKPREATRAEADGVARMLGLRPGAEVVDLGCGVGRIALELARRGFSVTGVDLQSGYLARARRSGDAEKLSCRWIRGDLRDFVMPGSFDGAVNLFTTFGYFARREDDLQFLRNVRASLRPGGVFVMDLMGKEVLARTFAPRSWARSPDGTVTLLMEASISEEWGYTCNRWTLLKGGTERVHEFRLRLYSGTELAEALKVAGFSDVELFGNFEGSPYGPDAVRLIARARGGTRGRSAGPAKGAAGE